MILPDVVLCFPRFYQFQLILFSELFSSNVILNDKIYLFCSDTPSHKIMLKTLKLSPYVFLSLVITFFYSLILQLILLQNDDAEINPDPRKTKLNSFLSCHWNVNSFISNKMATLYQIGAYSTIYKYNVICISETYFDSSLSVNDKRIQKHACNLMRSDLPSNTKRECLYLQ